MATGLRDSEGLMAYANITGDGWMTLSSGSSTVSGDTVFYGEEVSWRTCQLCNSSYDVKQGHLCIGQGQLTIRWDSEEEEGTMNDGMRKFFTKLVARKRLTEEALEEVEAIMAHPDWEKRFLLYLLVTEKDVLLETLGYERPDESE